jgi:arginine decarboxylase
VTDLLDYVNISSKTLEYCYKQKINAASLDKFLETQYLNELIQGLDGYTYLED